MTKENKSVTNFPNLRFPGFEEQWEVKMLGEVCEINPRSLNLPDTFNYIDLESVVDGILIKENLILKKDAPSRAQRLLHKNDVLFQMVRPYQKNNFYFYLDGDYVASTGYAQIRTEQNPQFIFQHLHNQKFVDKVIERCTGTSYPAINSTDLSKISICIPAREEQQKITSLLSFIDNRIGAQKKIIKKLQTLMKCFREKIFSQEIRFNDDHAQAFPNWEYKRIKDILTIGGGKDYKHLDTGDIPVYGTGGIITFVNSFLYDGETVCIGRKGTIDKPLFLKGKIWTVDTLFYTHSFKEAIPRFIFHLFQGVNWKEYNEASGVPSLSKSTIEKITFVIPCMNEQYKIAQFLSPIDEKIATEKKILAQYELQKKHLLANLFV